MLLWWKDKSNEFISTGTVLYCGSSDGLVNFWEWDRKLSHAGVLRGHKLAVLCLATAQNLLFSGSADMSICVWKRSINGEHYCMSILKSHSGPVKCLAVEKDPETMCNERRWILYSGSLDKSVKTWRVSEHSHIHHQSHRNMIEVYPRSSSRSPSQRKLGSRRCWTQRCTYAHGILDMCVNIDWGGWFWFF